MTDDGLGERGTLRSGPALSRRPVLEPPAVAPGSDGGLVGEEGWRLADAGPLRWRRFCESCQAFVVPDAGARVVAEGDDLLRQVPCQRCPTCHVRWPGPPLMAMVRIPVEYPNHSTRPCDLRLSAGEVRLRSQIPTHFADDPWMVDGMWRNMELYLLDTLTFRDPCSVAECSETARAFFTVNLTVVLFGRRWEPSEGLAVCPDHECELLGDPALGWTLEPVS